MSPKIDSMHFVFWFKQGSFGLAQTKFADFLNKFSDLIAWSQYILPLGEEVNWDAPIMSLDWQNTRIVISKERLNVFFENQETWWDLSRFTDLIKQIYQKISNENVFGIDWIGLITYNQLQDVKRPQIGTYFLDYLNREKRKDFLNWEGIKANIRLERKKDLSIGRCNCIINLIDAKKTNNEDISILMFDINTKPQTEFLMNDDNLNKFLVAYQEERDLSLKLFDE